jgi:OOP family OmpA-OmpF porin
LPATFSSDFDKAVLRPEAAPALEKVALVIQSFEHPQVTVEGHSDNVGADAYNQALSERRARAVQSWLASRNVTAPIATRGWGESKPVVPNTNPTEPTVQQIARRTGASRLW